MWLPLYFSYFLILFNSISSIGLDDLNVPPEHVTYVFNAFPSVADACLSEPQCKYRELVGIKSCWGYEHECHKNVSYPVQPVCPGDHRGWVKTKQAQIDTFYTQADFGKY